MYNRHVFYHALGSDPANDPLIFGEGRDPEDWPAVVLSNDGRWLSIVVSQGWTRSEVFLKDVQADTPPQTVIAGTDSLYTAEPYDGYVYIVTNEGAPCYRSSRLPSKLYARTLARDHSQTDAVLAELHVIGGQLFVKYEKDVPFAIEALRPRRQPAWRYHVADARYRFLHSRRARWWQCLLSLPVFTSPPPFTASTSRHGKAACGIRWASTLTRLSTKLARHGTPRRTAREFPCLLLCAKG